MGRPAAGDHPAGPGADLHWVKSSWSYSNGNCVEVAFRRSSRCQNGECAEVAHLPGGQVLVRDSNKPEGPVLRFTPAEWRAFLGGVRNGEFDGFGQSEAAAANAP